MRGLWAFGLACGCGLSVRGVAPEDTVAPDATVPDASEIALVDASASDGPALLDGGAVPDADGSIAVPDGCVGPSDFTYDGDPNSRTVGDGGVIAIAMKKDARVALTRTFDAGKAYTRSKVELLVDVAWDGTWGAGGGDYVPFFRQYFGAKDDAPVNNDVVMAQNVLEAHIRPGSDTLGLGGMSVPQATNVTVVVATTWRSDSTGELRVTTPSKSWPLATPTASAGATATALTLVIGGTAKGNIPNVTITLRRACVLFDP
ncbi:MAG: hypothetical protein U0270_36645 [Labilithrix sp.]